MDYQQLIRSIIYPIIVYVLLLILARVIGKKVLSQLTFFDFVVGITMGTVGGAFITTELKGFYVLISPIILAILVFLTGKITLKNATARKLVEGEAVIVIQEGKILENVLKKLRYNQDLLLSQLRDKDIFDINQVEYAVLESQGILTVKKKDIYKNPTKKDLNIIPNINSGLSTELIKDGRVQVENLRARNLSEIWLEKELKNRGIEKTNEVFLATLSPDGKLYIDIKNDNLKSFVQKDDQDSIIR